MTSGLIVQIDGGEPRGAVARKRAVVVSAATALFLRQGYVATRIDQVAAAAAVSKQTVYNQFGDKEQLFRTVVLGATATAERFAAELPASFDDVTDAGFADALRALARRYLAATARPEVLALRRLIIGEAVRLPELAAEYAARAPTRVLTAFTELFARLGRRGLLHLADPVADPAAAARHFAFLVVGPAIDHGLLHVTETTPDDATVIDAADRAVAVFLAAYGR